MKQTTPSGSLIVFGAASARLHTDRIASLDRRPAQVVILDPLIDPAAPPVHLVAGAEKTTHLDCIAGAEDGEVDFSVWSANALMGPKAPAPALRTLFPGLRPRQNLSVRVRAFESLVEGFATLPDPVKIWIDAPGSEADILDLVRASPLASRVAEISIRTGVEAFFEGARSSEQLITELQAQGFRLATCKDEDPDFPELTFEIDRHRLETASLQAELEQATQERETTQQELASLQAQSAVLEARLTDLMADNGALTAQIDGQAKELSTLAEALEEARAEVERATRLKAELVTARQERDAARAEVEAMKAELSKVKEERHAMWQQRDNERATLAETQATSKTEIEALRNQVSDLKQRHSLAKEELRRAEGQVELIKDLLLRETVL